MPTSDDPTTDRTADLRLDQAWDALCMGLAPTGADPADVAALAGLHALAGRLAPAPAFVRRIEEDLMAAPAPSAAARTAVAATSPNGHHGTPERVLPLVAPVPARRTRLGAELATAAALLLILLSALATYRLGPFGPEPTPRLGAAGTPLPRVGSAATPVAPPDGRAFVEVAGTPGGEDRYFVVASPDGWVVAVESCAAWRVEVGGYPGGTPAVLPPQPTFAPVLPTPPSPSDRATASEGDLPAGEAASARVRIELEGMLAEWVACGYWIMTEGDLAAVRRYFSEAYLARSGGGFIGWPAGAGIRLEVRDARVLPDGRVGAVLQNQADAGVAYLAVFVRVGDRWLIDELATVFQPVAAAPAPPAATATPAIVAVGPDASPDAPADAAPVPPLPTEAIVLDPPPPTPDGALATARAEVAALRATVDAYATREAAVPAATPDDASSNPETIGLDPVEVTIVVDPALAVPGGNPQAEADAVAQLRAVLGPYAAGNCRVGFALVTGYAADIRGGNALAEAVWHLTGEQFPALVRETPIEKLAVVGVPPYGRVDLQLYLTLGCEPAPQPAEGTPGS